MGVPAGLKLNDDLDYCLGNLCLLALAAFRAAWAAARPALADLVRLLAASGLLGATVNRVTRTRTHARTHTHTHARTHAYTHTHTRARARAPETRPREAGSAGEGCRQHC